MKNKRIKIFGVSASVIAIFSFLFCATTVFAEATMFEFKLTTYGGSARTSSLNKNATGSAVLYVETVDTTKTLDKPLVARVRKSNNEMCSESLSFTGVVAGGKLAYWKGYGQTGQSYYLKMQTDTNGKVAATVVGVFQP